MEEWRRFNDQFRETEWDRNDRLRKKRLVCPKAERGETPQLLRCPKCGAASGDSWPCGRPCPMPMSPHYEPDQATINLAHPATPAAQPEGER